MILYIEAFSALGLFLFGMLYLEDSLKKAAGFAFKRWVKISTNTNAKAIFTGGIATTFLQSSSAVTLMATQLISTSKYIKDLLEDTTILAVRMAYNDWLNGDA